MVVQKHRHVVHSQPIVDQDDGTVVDQQEGTITTTTCVRVVTQLTHATLPTALGVGTQQARTDQADGWVLRRLLAALTFDARV